MLFRTHLAFSFLVFFLLWEFLEVEAEKWLFALVFMISAVIVDIDSSKSVIGRLFKPVGWIFGHRFWLHSVFAALLISLLVGLVDANYSYAVFFGYLSHLVLDMLNHQGIAPFYPASAYRIKGPFKSDGLTEKIIFVACFLGIIFLGPLFSY
ncbi:MAG: metal-dependent hydrolase [Nanoarchaeota archaeon]